MVAELTDIGAIFHPRFFPTRYQTCAVRRAGRHSSDAFTRGPSMAIL